MIHLILAAGCALFGGLLLATQPKSSRPHQLGIFLVAYAGSTAFGLLF